MNRSHLWAFLTIALAMPACSSDGGSADSADAMTEDSGMSVVDAGPDAAPAQPRLEFSPASFDIPLVGEGERVVRDITLTNASDASVEITNFGLNVATGTAVLVYGSRRIIGITADDTDTFPYPVAIEAGDTLLLSVEYTLGAGEPSGEVTIEGNFEAGTISIPIRSFSSVGTISAEPTAIDFGRVRANTTSTRTVTVTNTGETVLNVRDIQKDNNIYVSLSISGTDPVSMPAVYEDPDGDGEPGLAPGASFAIDVTFAPTREGTQRSLLIIDSDDPINPEIRIPMVGNESEGCILVSAESLNWTGELGTPTSSPELTVSNCGDGPLYIDRIGLTPGTADVLTLNDEGYLGSPSKWPRAATRCCYKRCLRPSLQGVIGATFRSSQMIRCKPTSSYR